VIPVSEQNPAPDRRSFLADGLRAAGVALVGGAAALLGVRKARGDDLVWQLDPDQCMACDKCATQCVLDVSAVKAVQFYPMCAMCDVCTGFFDVSYVQLDTGAENQLCPTGAIVRTLVTRQAGVPRYEYPITEPKCIGCGKCVKGCAMMNGSLYLQVKHDRCLNCNECSIALACPTQAFRRVPAGRPYLLKRKARRMLRQQGEQA
jgi:electron transport complex protein RnfB